MKMIWERVRASQITVGRPFRVACSCIGNGLDRSVYKGEHEI